MDKFDIFFEIAVDLNALLTAEDRYARFLQAMRKVIPFDAASLLRLEGDALVPVAIHGLAQDVLGRRFVRTEHPRLDIICSSQGPTRFAPKSPLPDPFDGYLAHDRTAALNIHDCLGCPLIVGGEVVGVLVADAHKPHTFDQLDERFLQTLGALASAAFRTTVLMEKLEHTVERQGLVANELMRQADLENGGRLVGESSLMRALRKEIDVVARSELTVLITGETGTGKEVVARHIHSASRRATKPLIYVNCAALPEALVESELFGHTRGAFTGAVSDRAGKFEVADGGTIFLDEIGELPLNMQAKLLRALQEGEIQRVGADHPLKVNVRVLAATNRNLEDEVAQRKFRSDLYHRLNVYPLHAPPLRDRRDDIPLLVGYFIDMERRGFGIKSPRIEPETLSKLCSYPWPGNVRELKNVISRGLLKAMATTPRENVPVLTAQELGAEFSPEAPVQSVSRKDWACTAPCATNLDLKDAVREFQRRIIGQALQHQQGNWAAAARTLGMHRSNLFHLAQRLGLRSPQ